MMKTKAPPKTKKTPPTYPTWEIPEIITVRGVKDFFDYIIKANGESNYGLINGEYFSKTIFKKERIAYERAFKDKRNDVLNKYDDGPIYKMNLFDKYLKDSLDAYNAGKKEIDINGSDEEIPNFAKLYNKGDTASDIFKELEFMVIKHIVRDLNKIKDPNNEFDNPPSKKRKKPTVKSLITESERAKLTAETEKASAIAIQNAIRANLARKVVKTTRASTPKVKKIKNEIVAKKIKNEIVPKASTPAPTAAKPTRERKAKINYKMSYAAAVKTWNTSRGNAMWCNPRKGSDEYKAVQQLRM
jgi:hypothetical protein